MPVLHSKELRVTARACPLLDGDPEVWVECCSKRFFPLAKRIVRDNDLAEDVLQESWVKILEAVHRYRGGPPACAWVRTIVANNAVDVHRKRNSPGARDLPEHPAESPEAAAAAKELRELLAAMIGALPETYRQILELRHGQGLSTKETADLLHISRANVSVRLNRAVSMLRRRLIARGVMTKPVGSALGRSQGPRSP